MALNSSDLGARSVWPLRFVPPHLPQIESVNGGRLAFLPTLIARDAFTDVSTADTDGISASHAGAGAAGTTNMTIGGALASGGIATLTPARNVVITVTHASAVVAMSGTITGKDKYGREITEAWSVTAGTTSKTFTGKKAFSKVTSITETVAADASGNTIIAGDGVVLGLSWKAAAPKIIAETEDGATPTAGVLVAASTASTADYLGTYAPNSAPNGSKDFVVWYLTDDPVHVQP